MKQPWLRTRKWKELASQVKKVRWFRWSLGELRLWSRVVQVELTSLFQVVGLKTRWVQAETCLCLEDWERGGRG